MIKSSAPGLVLVLWCLPGCLDPIVGGECKQGYSPCHGVCLPAGLCRTVDAATERRPAADASERETWTAPDAEAIDSGSTNASEDDGGIVDGDSTLDALTPVDVGGDMGSADAAKADGRRFVDGGTLPETPQNSDVPASSDVPLQDDLPPLDDASPILVVDAILDELANDAENADSGAIDAADAETGGLDSESDGGSATDDGGATADVAGQDDSGPDVFTPPPCIGVQILCNQQCVDPASFMSDPDNCGSCGVPCMSGLCSNGQCEAAGTGRAIVIGHDYYKNRPVMNRILGNGVFLWPVNPVRLLLYEGQADGTAIAGANAAIAQVAAATGRRYEPTVAQNPADVPSALASADVFLIYGQQSATDETLVQLGQDWKTALTGFLLNGGTVIILDGDYSNAGTVQILSQEQSGGPPKLFDIARAASATGDVCTVVERGDALASGLPRTYLCEKNSTSFTINDTASTITPVIADGTHTVVVHKIF